MDFKNAPRPPKFTRRRIGEQTPGNSPNSGPAGRRRRPGTRAARQSGPLALRFQNACPARPSPPCGGLPLYSQPSWLPNSERAAGLSGPAPLLTVISAETLVRYKVEREANIIPQILETPRCPPREMAHVAVLF